MNKAKKRYDNTKTNKCLIQDDEYFYRDSEMARSVIKTDVLSKQKN